MKILVVTSVFPNSVQPALGVFVRERMFHVAKHCELKVVAPVPWFPLAHLLKDGYRPRIPYLEPQDGVDVYHPRFFSIPRFFKGLDGFFFFLSSLYTVWKIKGRFNFDLIDAHFLYPDGAGAVLLGTLFNKPVTMTARESSVDKFLKPDTVRRQVQWALERAARIFSVSGALKRTVMAMGIPEDRVVVVPNGVDIEKFTPIDRLLAREELGLSLERKIIVSVGWLIERKGFHRIISALPRIAESIPGVMLVVVGGAPVLDNYEPQLKELTRQLNLENDVVLAGQQPHPELYKWYSAADIFCLATSNEGWANVFFEAMACGLPVVTTRVGGNEEAVSSDELGVLFDCEDQAGLAKGVITALTTDWNRGRIISHARANTWDERVSQLTKEFHEITGSFKRP